MLAVCQPSVPALAATAILNEANHPCRPASLTMMGGPIDYRARHRPRSATWPCSADRMVPPYGDRHRALQHHPAQAKRVYPGFMQLAGFMSMNLGNHAQPLPHVQAPGGWHGQRRCRCHQDLLRRIPRGLRSQRSLLPPDRGGSIPEAFAATAPSYIAADGRPRQDQGLPCWPWRDERDDISGSARPGRAHLSTGLAAAGVVPRRKSATTASSMAASGASRSPLCWRNGSPSTTARRSEVVA